jgi:hypothetical protein
MKRMKDRFEWYSQLKHDFYSSFPKLNPDSTDPQDPYHKIANRYGSGGLDQYSLMESHLKDFGDLKDLEESLSYDGMPFGESRSATAEPLIADIKNEAMQGVEKTENRWQAVNHERNESLNALAHVAAETERQGGGSAAQANHSNGHSHSFSPQSAAMSLVTSHTASAVTPPYNNGYAASPAYTAKFSGQMPPPQPAWSQPGVYRNMDEFFSEKEAVAYGTGPELEVLVGDGESLYETNSGGWTPWPAPANDGFAAQGYRAL